MGRAQKIQMELDPLILNYFFQKYEDENIKHIELFIKRKINSETIICCHPNYIGNGSWNDYVMIEYDINQGTTTTTKFFAAKLVAIFLNNQRM